ncbi:MAG TPA: amidohydrolase family protein [Methanomassiliicoccales archaeon]|nr:amidohydrolase family protein [Methanomassiliicoccales archaeon]
MDSPVQMSTAIRNALIVTQDRSRRVLRGDILIEEDRIQAIGDVREDADIEIDAKGDIVIPGLVNAHTHVSMSIMKGIADDLPFSDFLDRVFAIDGKRTSEDIAAGTRLGLMEMIAGGTTTFVDLYYSQEIIAHEVESAGIRGVLCWAVLDEQFTTQEGVPIDNCRRFYHDFAESELVYPGVGPQGVYVCSDETLLKASDFALEKNIPLTFHLSETRGEVYDYKEKVGKRPVEHLHDIGFLSENCLAAHSAWLTLREVRLLAENGVSVATCPVSNMKLATGGVAPIPEMLDAGVNVSLGTDGSTTNNSLDMFGEMKMLALLQKSNRWDATVLPAQKVLDAATIDGARAIGLGDQTGSIELGKKADLVILDGKAPNLNPIRMDKLASTLVYSASCLNVKTVLCNGRTIYLDREFMTLDEGKVLSDANDACDDLLGRTT